MSLPALPDLAIRIRDALRNPEIEMQGVVRLVQLDPGLAAYLIQIANSPTYRGNRRVDQLSVALSRIGLKAIRNLALSYALQAVYTANTAQLRQPLRQLWQQSSRLAALSTVLARHCKGFDPDRAMLAGLLQDVGCLPLLQKAASFPDLFGNDEALQQLMQRYAANVGSTLLTKWGFDADLIDVVRSREQWQRNNAVADYADIVLVARIHQYAGTPQASRIPKMSSIPALTRLPIGEISPEFSLQLLEEARNAVQELQQALGGV